MSDIGIPQREIEFEPLPDSVPVPEKVPEPTKVPATQPA